MGVGLSLLTWLLSEAEGAGGRFGGISLSTGLKLIFGCFGSPSSFLVPPARGPFGTFADFVLGSWALFASFLAFVPFFVLTISGLVCSSFLLLVGGDSPVFSGLTFLFALGVLLPSFLGLFLSLCARVGCTDFGDWLGIDLKFYLFADDSTPVVLSFLPEE